MNESSDLEKLILSGFFGLGVVCTATAHGLPTAHENGSMSPSPAVADQAETIGASTFQSGPPLDDLCTFAPEPDPCAPLYRKAMHSSSPAVRTIREAYEGYARYLKNDKNTLTTADQQYVKGLEIDLPDDLNSAQQSGLHNVINDPALLAKADDRRAAVINFILRAEQANLYCGQNFCPSSGRTAPQAQGNATAGDTQGHI